VTEHEGNVNMRQ